MRMRFDGAGKRSSARRQISLGRRLWVDFKALGALLLLWQDRARQRHHLAALSEHLRRDLGLSNDDIIRESRKPFWRA